MQLRSVQTRKRALPFLRLADAFQRGLPGPAAFLPVPVALVLARSLASSSAPRACPALLLPGVPTPPHQSRDAWSFGSQLQCAFPREATQPPHLKPSPTTTRRLWRPTAVWHRPAWVLIVRPPPEPRPGSGPGGVSAVGEGSAHASDVQGSETWAAFPVKAFRHVSVLSACVRVGTRTPTLQ